MDLVEVARITKACERGAFLRRLFTEAERRLIGDRFHLAADNFAVKEAVAKVFGTGFGKYCMPVEIEVLRNERGKPFVNLYGSAASTAQDLGIQFLHISITNTKELAGAYAVGEGRSSDDGGLSEICS